MDIFAQYAQIKQQLAELEEKRKELELQVLDELDEYGNSFSNRFGKFTSYGRNVYKYSSRIDALKANLSRAKKEEEASGEAVLEKVTSVLTFTPIK